MKKLFIKPTGGLGNRMNAIASAVQMAKDQHRELYIFWEQKWELNAKFTDIFELNNLTIYNKDIYNFPNRAFSKFNFKEKSLTKGAKTFIESEMYRIMEERKSYDFIRYFHQFNNEPNVFIETCFNFYQNRSFKLKDLFIPNSEVKNKLAVAKSRLGEDYVALHIRRTDNDSSIENSPDALFFDRIAALETEAKVFLCTDDLATEKRFVERFGTKIVCISEDKSRDTKIGIQSALVDLLLLANSKKVFGSFNSTFSSIAAEIGEVEFEVLKK